MRFTAQWSTSIVSVALGAASLVACSAGPTAGSDVGGSVVLSDLGTEGNAAAIAQYNAFRGQLDSRFTARSGNPVVVVSGFNNFQGSDRNVSRDIAQNYISRMDSETMQTRSVDGMQVTRGTINHNGKPMDVYVAVGNASYETPPLMAALTNATQPDAVMSYGQTSRSSRIEIGNNNSANTQVEGFDKNGNVSKQFGENYSEFFNEAKGSSSYTARGQQLETLAAFAEKAQLPLSNSSNDIGNYICNAFSVTNSNMVGVPGDDGKTIKQEPIEFYPGFKVEPVARTEPARTATGQPFVAFGHVAPEDITVDRVPQFTENNLNGLSEVLTPAHNQPSQQPVDTPVQPTVPDVVAPPAGGSDPSGGGGTVPAGGGGGTTPGASDVG